MAEFLVERYVPRLDASLLAGIAARLEHAAAELAAVGIDVRWQRSVGILEEEMCLCFFTAETLHDVIAANERSGVEYERIAEVSVERMAHDSSLDRHRGRPDDPLRLG